GRNTGYAKGLTDDQMPLWDPRELDGGADPEAYRRARAILWRGWCSVHKRFTIDQVRQARAGHPGVRILVHPECTSDVVAAADLNGSTEFIVRQVRQAPAGTVWAIGTEINLVHRLAQEHPEQTIFCLDPVVCPCSTMYRIHPSFLLWALENLVEGRVVNQIAVSPEIRQHARVALERMLAVH
ncbi:MAG: quinolinate synthase NadA, partial [Actinobacteria bacterium]|nr:quinolinate synthase NadA [Actinomycetota bacterium]